MRWYEGDIAEAVTMSKSKNSIFVVYVEGKDDKSTNLTSLINATEISSKLESNTFVAIKVEAGSVSHNQFAAIYKSVPVPSIFFIGKNGKPIDIVLDSASVSDLSTRINSIIEVHTGISPSISQETLQSTSAKQSEDLIKSEQNTENVKCENGTCHIVSDVDEAKEKSPTPTESAELLEEEKANLSKEEKIQRAKELVDLKRETKKQEEEEAARLKEIERRKTGQDVQKMRRWQQDQELKNLMEERQRAKNEEKAARDRILAQIAQDKADRAARFSSSPPSAQQTPEPSPPRASSANSNTARLQFRLPDGSSNTHDFDSDATLQEVRNYISNNLNLPFRNYNLATSFPRREFTADNLEESLRDLQLCPNAVVLVLPATTASAIISPEGGGFVSLIWFLLSPVLGVFGYFKSLIFGQPPERNKRQNDEALSQQTVKRKATESTAVRRQGNSNIHRLSDRSDSDDDNNTWNGNSTQQM